MNRLLQVAKIDIGYAKTAKKMDVKRLKAHMWDILATPPKETEAEPDKEDENDPNKTQVGTYLILVMVNLICYGILRRQH